MKISKLDIYGYGKWINQTFDIDEQLQIFYGQNEAGKSTLQSFIRSILFGFPTKHKRNNPKNSYEPKSGTVYGGRLLLTDTEYGDIWIERTSKKFAITTVNGETLDNEVLSQILSGMDEKLFDTFYAFNLENFSEFSRMNAEQLNDHFMSISTVGSDQFLKIAKKLEKETDEMYRVKGQNRPINKTLAEYEELANKVEMAKSQLLSYDHLVNQRDFHESEILKYNQSVAQLEKEARELDKVITRYDSFIKHQSVTNELSILVETEMDETYPETVKSAMSAINNIQEQMKEHDGSIKSIEGELGTLTRFNWAANHQEQRLQWEQLTSRAKDAQAKVEMYTTRIEEHQQKMKEQATTGQFDPNKVKNNQEYYLAVAAGQDYIDRINALELEMENAIAERNILFGHRRQFQNYAVTVRSQIATLESQRMNDEARLVEETSFGHFVPIWIGIISAIGLFGFNYFYNGNSRSLMWAAIILGVISIIAFFLVKMRHRKQSNRFNSNPTVDKISELKNNEQAYQDQGNEVGTEINARESLIKEKQNQIALLKEEMQEWKNNIGFHPDADIDLIVKYNPVKEYFESANKVQALEKMQSKEMETVSNWRRELQPLFERFPTEEKDYRTLIRYVEDVEGQLKVVQLRGEHLQENIEENRQKIEKLERKLAAYQKQLDLIFRDTDSQSEYDFFYKVKNNERIHELKEKQKMLFEQFTGFEHQLDEIESKDELIEQSNHIENQIQTYKDYLLPLQNERANLEVQIRNMEQDGTYESLLQQMENKKDELRELIYRWGTKRIAMELIYRTLRHGMSNPLPKMTQLANAIFEKLSFGRYNQIKINKDDITVMQFSGILFEPYELSQGTLEQLYVALRLAFVESATSIVKLPIIIDDAFVNFDQQRKERMYEVLKEFCQTSQILYFTTAREVFNVFDNEQIKDLDN